jgi:hypothetical protein
MRYVLWFSVMLTVGLYICSPIVDPDLWWHLTFGKWIVAHKEIPSVDHWNMWGEGQPWRAYSWSNEIVLYFFDHYWGEQGLLVAKLLLGVALAFSLFYCLGKIANDWFVGCLLGIFATCACYNHFTLRPQTLVWIYLAWLILLADRIDRQGLSGKRVLGLLLVMCLWANAHITTALGILVLCGWSFKPTHEGVVFALKLALIAFIGTLFTPYFGGEWLTFFSKTGHPFAHSSVAEFQPATIMQFSTGFLILVVALLMAFLHIRPWSLRIPQILVGGAFIMAALAVVKFIPFAVIVLSALCARIWANESADRRLLGNLAEGIENLRTLINEIPKEGLSFVFLVLAFINFHKVWDEPVSHDIIPVEAVDFMIEHNLPHPILNDFGRGGYIMYRYSDEKGNLEHKVPIDGRTNVTPHEIWEEFHSALFGKLNWRDYIERVNPQTILWRTESALSSILLNNTEWCLVKQTGDDESGYLVFLKESYYRKRAGDFTSRNCDQQSEQPVPKPAEDSAQST